VPGRDDATGGDVVASVAAMISRVPDEDARTGARGELVRRRGEHVGVAATSEHPEFVVGGRHAEEE
jgi:hypothetical protein